LIFLWKIQKKIGSQIRKKQLSVKEIGIQLQQANAESANAVYVFTRGLISTQKTKLRLMALDITMGMMPPPYLLPIHLIY
jgi:hypothetical protein